MVRRLFSWSADSFIVHLLDSPLSTSLSTASMHLLDLSLSTSFVDHFHCQPHCRLPASAGLSLLLTSSSTASARWTYFVVGFIVDGQHLLYLLCQHCRQQTASVNLLKFLSSTSSGLHSRQPRRRPASAGLTLSTLSSTASVCWTYFVVYIIADRWPA